jgi:hypothetical protein
VLIAIKRLAASEEIWGDVKPWKGVAESLPKDGLSTVQDLMPDWLEKEVNGPSC